MRKIAIIGTGNVGISAAKAVSESSDMELIAFVSRNKTVVGGFPNVAVVKSVKELSEKLDGAIICLPSELVEQTEKELLKNGIFTVDAFDIHEELDNMKERMEIFAKEGNATAIVGAGWEPGLDSIIRTLMLVAFPNSVPVTNFGPGMSMGHSVAARAAEGVKDAIAFTVPIGNGKHTRIVYAVPKSGVDRKQVEQNIKNNRYFERDECSVEFMDSIELLSNTNHRVEIESFDNAQKINFCMQIDNPTLTGRILCSAMRAVFKQNVGAYFMTEVPPVDLCENCRKNIL